MNKNVMAIPYWAKEILKTLECSKFNTLIFIGRAFYFGTNDYHHFVVSEDEDDEGKPLYTLSYSRRDCSMPNDVDKHSITSRLVPLLGEPVDSCEGVNCNYLYFNRKVN